MSSAEEHSPSQLTADNSASPASQIVTTPWSPANDPLLQTKYRTQLYVQVSLSQTLYFTQHTQ